MKDELRSFRRGRYDAAALVMETEFRDREPPQ
jgi:hypothetical protein